MAFTAFILLDTFLLSTSYKVVEEKKEPIVNESTEIIREKNYYKDNNIEIKLTSTRKYNTDIYIADIKIKDINYLKTAFAKNTFGKNVTDYTSTIAKNHEAILAINGDFYGVQEKGFVLKNGHLHQVTKPHSLVNLLVEAGQLTEEEAKYHPKKNVLMKALGAMEKVELDIFDVDLTSEAILLCSDGLTNMLTTEQIEKVLNDETLEMEEKVIKLIRKSNARGGQDNISVAYLVIKESGDTNDNEGAKD